MHICSVHVFLRSLCYRADHTFTLGCLLCEVQTISAAEYSTWRNSTWQHTSKAEAVWRRGCEAIFLRKNCDVKKSKLHKSPPKAAAARVGNAWAFPNKRRRREMHLFLSREKCESPISPPTPARKHGTPHDLLHAHPFYDDRPLLDDARRSLPAFNSA